MLVDDEDVGERSRVNYTMTQVCCTHFTNVPTKLEGTRENASAILEETTAAYCSIARDSTRGKERKDKTILVKSQIETLCNRIVTSPCDVSHGPGKLARCEHCACILNDFTHASY